MKNEVTNISLSFCCKKDWNTFKSIDEQSRFCGSCNHRVVDFTKATAEDFAKARQQDEKVCGRFTRFQMSTGFLNSMAAAAVVYSGFKSCNDPLTNGARPNEKIEVSQILMGIPVLPPQIHGNIKIVNDAGDSIATVPFLGSDEDRANLK